jgi:translation initiation factor 2 subunit 1|tara:strand:- start:921 stop:1055 length:135 start_codon:yes stop_codon:yes gene_type:complete
VNVKEPPRAVSERDERLLAEKIEKITEEATDSDSDGETMGSVDI